MCRTATPDDKICDQCKRHGLECIYLEHRRGRKLGSRNKRRALSGDSDSPPGPAAKSSRPELTAIFRPESHGLSMGQPEISHQPTYNVADAPTVLERDLLSDSPYTTASLLLQAPQGPPQTVSEMDRHTHSPHYGLSEQSPLALLARTAAQSKGEFTSYS